MFKSVPSRGKFVLLISISVASTLLTSLTYNRQPLWIFRFAMFSYDHLGKKLSVIGNEHLSGSNVIGNEHLPGSNGVSGGRYELPGSNYGTYELWVYRMECFHLSSSFRLYLNQQMTFLTSSFFWVKLSKWLLLHSSCEPSAEKQSPGCHCTSTGLSPLKWASPHGQHRLTSFIVNKVYDPWCGRSTIEWNVTPTIPALNYPCRK